MAYNLQLPGSDMLHHMSWRSKDFAKRRKKKMIGSSMSYCTMYQYKEKIGYSTPSLCFQKDVMFPNALAAVSGVSCEENRFVMGCKGNQIHRDFALEPRVPVAVPLIQYPSNVSGPSLSEMDICAKPVLNWEEYITNLKLEFSHNSLLWSKGRKTKKVGRINKLDVEQSSNSHGVTNENGSESSASDEQDGELLAEQNIEDATVERDSESSGEEENELLAAPQPSTSAGCQNKAKVQARKIPLRNLVSHVFRNRVNLDLSRLGRKREREEENKDLLAQGKTHQPPQALPPISEIVGSLGKHRTVDTKQKLLLTGFKKFKSQPKLRIEATWNYVYGGLTGACCCVESSIDKSKNIYAACQTKLRKVTLQNSGQSSMLSYKLKSVWEEDLPKEPYSINDTIFQIVPSKSFDMIGVRRGKRIGIYSIEEEAPYLLDNIPNICFGTNVYKGWEKINHFEVIKDPLLLGFDFNPQYTPEIITLDENMQIRICDIFKRKTISNYYLSKSPRIGKIGPGFEDYPKFRRINDASGISFSTYGQVFFAWGDSKVVLGDRRDFKHARASLMDIFDLRRSTSSISWSDQTYFNDSKPELNDYISSLKRSGKEYYYYVGTTTKIFLMDLRVPGHPVLKMDHGMRTAATYLDTYTNDSFEVVVAASQRLPSTFCGITDHAHINCGDRPSCEAINPVLNCLPRHLSSSMEFFDTAFAEGCGLSWEADHRRAMNHNYAWTTGLSICKGSTGKDPLKPPGILVFTTNCFGDVFFQEWEQGPIEECRKTGPKDCKFKQFLEQWRDSMKSKTMTEFQKPTLNPKMGVDCSLLVETCARKVRRMTKVRDKPFDPFTPNEIQHQHVEETQTTFEDRFKQLRNKYHKSKLANSFLDVWSTDDTSNLEEVEVKLEEDEMQRRFASESNDDGTFDVEYIDYAPQEAQEMIELEQQIHKEVQEQRLPTIMEHDDEDLPEESTSGESRSEEELLSLDSKAESSDSDLSENEESDREVRLNCKELVSRNSGVSAASRSQKHQALTDRPSSQSKASTSTASIEGNRNLSRPPIFESDTSEEEGDAMETIETLPHRQQDVTEMEDELFCSSQPQPTSSHSPELWSQFDDQDYIYNPQAEHQQEDHEERDYNLRQSEDDEFGDFILASQPKAKKISKRSGF